MTHPGTAKLQRYVLGELSATARLLVDQHVAECPRCRELVESERLLDELIVGSLGGASSQGDEDAAFTRLWAAVDAEPAAVSSSDPALAPVGPSGPTHVLGDLAEATEPAPQRRPRPRLVASWIWTAAAAAAALLVVVWWMLGRGDEVEPGAGRAQRSVVQAPAQRPRQDAEPRGLPEPNGRLEGSLGAGAVAADQDRPPRAPDVWEPVDADRLEVARATVADVLRGADEQFPFATDAFRLACDEGLSKLRMQGWPVTALVRGLALGTDDQTAGAALRHAALDRSNDLVLARALESERRVDDALAVLDVGNVEVGHSSSLVKALERVAGSSAAGDSASGTAQAAARRRAALEMLAAGTGPRVRHAWDRLAGRTAADLLRLRDTDRAAAVLLHEAAQLWPPDVAVALLEEVAEDSRLEDAGRAAFLAHAGRLGAAAVQRLDDSLARTQQAPALLPWCVAASLEQVVPTLIRALEDGRDPDELLAALSAFGGPDAALGLHALWRDSHSPNRGDRYLSALTGLFEADDTLASRFGASVPLEDAESLAELASALPIRVRRGVLTGALMASHAGGDLAGHRASLIVALGRTGSTADGEELLRWITERPAHDRLLPLAWAAAGRLAPDAASLAWRERVGDPRLLKEVVDDVSRRLAAAVEPTARTLAPLTAALERAASQRALVLESLPMNVNPSMENLP